MKKQNMDEELITDLLHEEINEMFEEVFSSKTFKIGLYLLKYIYDRDLKYYNLFIEEFKKLSLDEQIQVLTNVSSNLREHNHDKLNKHKKKKKGKNVK